ncbi:MAG: GPP34 family phosphoprotein [Actinocrinis sp.]
MTSGADLVLLAVDAGRGGVRLERQLGFALAAAELVDLASARRVEAVDRRIAVTERLRTGDLILDETLDRLGEDPKGYPVGDWIAMRAPDRVRAHVVALMESGDLSGRLVTTRIGARPEPFGLGASA